MPSPLLTSSATETAVQFAITFNPDSPPDLALIEAAGAHLIALHQAAVAAHTTRIETGAENA